MWTQKTFRIALPLLFGVLVVVFLYAQPAHAAAGINQQINYQARLLNSAGAVVADGNYNIRFKIYQDGTGTLAGNPSGTLKWTELWQNSNSQGVVVKNGYFSVSLGSLCAFTGGSCQGNTNTAVDFNQDTLWLSVDIGGTGVGANPTYDGEMLPMRRLSASPYAMNAGLLGGFSAAQFLQLAPNAAQVDVTTNSSIFINKTGASGNIVQLQNAAADVFTLAKTGTLALKTTTDSATALQVINSSSLSVLTVDTLGSNISLLGNNSSTLSTWTTTTAMSVGSNTSRVRGGAIAANGYLYSIGGLDGTSTTVATVGYAKLNADGTVGTWASTTALPAVRRQFQPVIANGYLYVIGGRDNAGTAQSTSYYAKLNADGTVGTWNTTTALTTGAGARFGQGTVAYGGYIFVVGGFDTGVTPQSTVYSIKANPDGTLGSTWTSITALPTGITDINGTTVANGYVYVAGGFVTGSIFQDDMYYAKLNLDGTTGSWTTQANILPVGDENYETYIANGYLYAVGGETSNKVVAFPLNANGSLGTVVTLTNFPLNPIGEASMAAANGYFYLLGGSTAADGGGTARNTVYYAGTSRVRVGGNLDLVSFTGENLAEGGTGGQLTAGNSTIVGTLQVQDTANFTQSVNIGGGLQVNGISVTNTSGTLTTGLGFTGTIGTDINRASGTLSLQGAGGITLASSGGNIVLGSSDTTGTILVLDTKTSFTSGAQVGDPTGVAGGLYYNSATGAFRCYEIDHWRDCLVSARSSYNRVFELGSGQFNGLGELTGYDNGDPPGTGALGFEDGETGHPGIAKLSLPANVAGYAYIGSVGNNEIRLGNNDYWRAESELRIPTGGLSSSTQRYIVRAGFIEQSVSTDGADGCFFKYSDNINSGKWQGLCESNSDGVSTNQSTCDTTITVAAASWYRLTVAVNAAGTSVDFRINGTSQCTITTNIPTASTRVTGRGVSMQRTVGSTVRVLDIDYEEIEGQFGTAR